MADLNCAICEKLKSVPLVQCRSKRKLEEINKSLLASVERMIEKNMFWPDETKAKVMQTFSEVYKKSMQENVTFAGKTWTECDDLDTTPEYFAVDQEKKDQLTQEVLPVLESQLVDIGRKRWKAPYDAAKRLAIQCKLECIHMTKLKVKDVKTSNVCIPVENDLRSEEETRRRVTFAGNLIRTGAKDLQQDVTDVGHVEMCTEMLQDLQNCAAFNIINRVQKIEDGQNALPPEHSDE